MTNHKFTDDQIIRCLNECYGKENVVAHIVDQGEDELVSLGRILEIINRQKSEIERLEKGELHEAMTFNSTTINRCVASAIKEFAERMKAEMRDLSAWQNGDATFYLVSDSFVDRIVKEMTEEHTHEMQPTDRS